jgi:hypothetical protein
MMSPGWGSLRGQTAGAQPFFVMRSALADCQHRVARPGASQLLAEFDLLGEVTGRPVNNLSC